MNTEKLFEMIFSPFDVLAAKSGIEYFEFIAGGEGDKSSYKKIFNTEFPYMSYDVAAKMEEFRDRDRNAPCHLELTSKYKHKIFCHIYPLKRPGNIIDTFIFETVSAMNENTETVITYLAGLINGFTQYFEDEKFRIDKSEKYRQEIGNIRDIQVKLFPRFDNIQGMDIRSAFLPAEFMSGTFIDGFFLDDSVYQLSACDVSDYGPASSFVGAAIKTILRSDAPKKMIPSAMLDTIVTKIKNIISGQGGAGNIYLTIYQINIKTGKAVLSSLGNITTLFYTKKRNGMIDLALTESGRLFSNRNFLRDMSINLEEGDTLLYYSRGIIKARSEDAETEYGIGKLKDEMKSNIESGSLEIVHSLIESVYGFTDYAQLDEDVILISMKRTG